MRIAYFLGEFPATSHTFIVRQITAMIERGHDVTIIAQRRGSPDSETDAVRKYELLRRADFWPRRSSNPLVRLAKGVGLWAAHFPRSPGVFGRAIIPWQFGRRALSFDLVYGAVACRRHAPFDVVHCHFGPTARVATMLHEIGALQGPLLVTFHGSAVLRLPLELAQKQYAPVFAAARYSTVGSRYMFNRLTDMGADPERLCLLPMGVDPDDCEYRSPRSHLDPREPVRLLSVARLVEVKGIEFAVRAVDQVIADGTPIDYTIIGEGPLRGDLERLVEELGIAHAVTFAGALPFDEVRRQMTAADLFVMPSVRDSRGSVEAQGVALLEAQATGLPVITTNLGGPPDGVPEANRRFVVRPADPQAIADAIQALVASPESWPTIAAAGRQHVTKHFHADRIHDRLEHLYQTIAAGETLALDKLPPNQQPPASDIPDTPAAQNSLAQ